MSSVKTWRVGLLVVGIIGFGWVASKAVTGGSISDQTVVETSSDNGSISPSTSEREQALEDLWGAESASTINSAPDDETPAPDEVITGSATASRSAGSTEAGSSGPSFDPTAALAAAIHGEVEFQVDDSATDAAAEAATANGDGTDEDLVIADADDSDGEASDETEGEESEGDAETTTTSIFIDPDAEATEEEVAAVQAAQEAAAREEAEAARNQASANDLNPVPQQTSGAANPPKETVSAATTSASLYQTEYGADGLPILQPLPTNPYEKTPNILVGRIRIPRIGLDHTLHQGMTLTAINRGPSHWPGTALPGQPGNMVIGGHRTTYSRPFRNLDNLQQGDEVIYETNQGTFTYLVTSVEIVSPEDVGYVAGQTTEKTATLFACHPPGSARQRIIAKMKLKEV